MTKLTFNNKKGVLKFSLPVFHSQQGILEINTDKFIFTSCDLSWKNQGNYRKAKSLFFRLKLYITKQSLIIEIENTSQASYKVNEITLMFPPSSFSPVLDSSLYSQYIRHLFPLSGAGIYKVNREPVTKEENQSYGVTLFHNITTSFSFLLGVLGRSSCITSFKALYSEPHKESSFGINIKFNFSCILEPRKKIVSPKLVVLSSYAPLSLLEQYGQMWKKEIGFRAKSKIIGWNSWDYYGGGVSEKDVKENIKVIKANYPEVKFIIIDDGWQERWGEWESNHRFPSGLKGLVKKIKAEGLIPGIWIAPYLMHIYSPFCHSHQDCLVKDKEGKPVIFNFSGGPVVLLDPTHPLVVKYIRKLFKKLKDAGFSYFKLDFANALLSNDAEIFYDRTIGKMAIMRKALEIIRETVGKESYILSGTFPLEASAGLLNAVRITNDIHNFWGHIKRNALFTACSFWMQGNLWNNDPDFLIVRSKNTSNDKYFNVPYQIIPFSETGWKSGREANEEELKVWATIILLSGGEIILSDNLARLNMRGKNMIKKVLLEKIDSPALPFDLFSSSNNPPSVWIGERNGSKIVGIINWDENTKTFFVDKKKWAPNTNRVIDIWEGGKISLASIENVTLLPHQVKLLKFTK